VSGIIAYVRVSTEEQAQSGAGLDAQRASILAEARRRGWAIDDITFIEDAGFSGKDLRRPGVVHALDALHRGEADTLVVAKLDRLSRSMADLTRLLGIAAKQGWALVALDVNVDTTTPTGEAMAHVVATFAQLGRRLIGQRTKEALAARRAAGQQLGRPRTLPDAVVGRVIALRASGRPLAAIADELNQDGVPTAQGGRQWHASTVAKVLRSRAATGRDA
jgi:DNA invertase Pin-like site-specific DNA recombinase